MKDKKQNIVDELERFAPELARLKNESFSDVPKYYFENLKVPKAEKQKIVNLAPSFWWRSMVASVAILIFVGFFIHNHRSPEIESDLYADLTIDEYLENDLDNIEEEDLIFLLDDDFELDIISDLSESEIDQYLESNVDEFSDLDLEKLY